MLNSQREKQNTIDSCKKIECLKKNLKPYIPDSVDINLITFRSEYIIILHKVSLIKLVMSSDITNII